MTPQKIDLIFPFVVFAYGVLVTFVVYNPRLMDLAEERFPPRLLVQMKAHRVLALVCLVLGSFWSLQNIWFYGG